MRPRFVRRFSPYVHGMVISDEERLQRIGELVHKAAVLWWAAIDAGEIPHPDEPRENFPPASLPTNDSERILHHLARVRHAAPRDFRLELGLSRATVQRRLAELLKAGRIAATGKTHGRSYTLPSLANSATAGQRDVLGMNEPGR